jgi:hypothetical protein
VESVNLNLMTRRELMDSLARLDPAASACDELNEMLLREPHEAAADRRYDTFEVDFNHATIEQISFAMEQYAWELAENHVVAVEEDDVGELQSARFYYWQGLSEKWHYLELMVDQS